MIVYLHGFRSSPASAKSTLLRAHLCQAGRAQDLWCEPLPPGPAEAIACIGGAIESAAASGQPVALAGSSLGGFYAVWLAERYGLPAVLINPAVVAPQDLSRYVGHHTHLHSGESFEFTAEHVEQLKRFDVPMPTRPERYLLLLETGDEVLDYWQAVLRLRGANMVIHAGGDHSLQCFGAELPRLLDFCDRLQCLPRT